MNTGNTEINFSFERPRPINEILPRLGVLQQGMRSLGIPSLVAGGVAVDLHALNNIPNHKARGHKDVELLVPVNNRGRFIQELANLGFTFDNSIHTGDIHLMEVRLDGVPYQIFFTYGNGEHTYTPFIFTGKRVGGDACEINPSPVQIEHNSQTFDVLEARSLLRIKEAFQLGSQSDTATLRKIIGE
jgi:hypothetical protein